MINKLNKLGYFLCGDLREKRERVINLRFLVTYLEDSNNANNVQETTNRGSGSGSHFSKDGQQDGLNRSRKCQSGS